jgi:hypothetical protein
MLAGAVIHNCIHPHMTVGKNCHVILVHNRILNIVSSRSRGCGKVDERACAFCLTICGMEGILDTICSCLKNLFYESDSNKVWTKFDNDESWDVDNGGHVDNRKIRVVSLLRRKTILLSYPQVRLVIHSIQHVIHRNSKGTTVMAWGSTLTCLTRSVARSRLVFSLERGPAGLMQSLVLPLPPIGS